MRVEASWWHCAPPPPAEWRNGWGHKEESDLASFHLLATKASGKVALLHHRGCSPGIFQAVVGSGVRSGPWQSIIGFNKELVRWKRLKNKVGRKEVGGKRTKGEN